MGSVKGLTIRNVKASGAQRPIILSGIEGHIIEGINLENLELSFKKPELSKKSRNRKAKKSNNKALSEYVVKIDTKGYPSSSLFGTLNSWGVCIRYAKNVQLNNIRLSRDEASTAHVMFLEEVKNILVNNNKIDSANSSTPWVKLNGSDSG